MLKLSKCKELFPTKTSFLIFVLYISLFVNQGILVTASQTADNKYAYNIVTAVLMTEVLKLIVSTILYLKDHKVTSLVGEIVNNKKVLLLYGIPSFLYCLYNNLSYENLSTFDPTTYFVLLQLRVVVTGILFQAIFNKILSKKQWLSLIVLTCGCMLKQINFSSDESSSANNSKSASLGINFSTILIFVQIFCSCFAGVYNEYLLKNQGADVNIFVQNIFMYVDSILCNVLLLTFNGDLIDAFLYDNITKILNFKVLIVIINNATAGIIASFFLKNFNSILKTFASALELVFTAILSYLFFSIPIYLNTVLAIATIFYATYMYSQSPVSASPHRASEDVDEEKLLNKEHLIEV